MYKRTLYCYPILGRNIKNRSIFFLINFGFFLISCHASDSGLSETIKNKIVKEIEIIHKDMFQAFNDHDAAKILSFIDQSENLRYIEHTQVTIGWDSLSKGFMKWHKENQNLSLELHQSYINVLSKDIAVLTASSVIRRDNVNFQNFTWTAVFQKKENGWKIVNAHEAFSDFKN